MQAIEFYENKIKKNALSLWKIHVNESKLKVTNEIRAERHDYLRLSKVAFRHWLLVRERREKAI